MRGTFLGGPRPLVAVGANPSRQPCGKQRRSTGQRSPPTQLTRSYSSREEVFRAALLEGLIPAVQADDRSQPLPADYRIEKAEQIYEPQPDWKLPREIS